MPELPPAPWPPPDAAESGQADGWEQRYLAGDTPWDTGQTPPEVAALVASVRVPTGWAIDLGCGSGATSRHLAAHGFRVIGLDLSQFALRRAAQAATAAGLACTFIRADVADLAFLRIRATLAVDVGCFHNLEPASRAAYVRSLAAHITPGGYYLLYTFLRWPSVQTQTPGPSVALTDIAGFAPWFVLRSAAHGEDRGRSSAWFLMQRA